MHNFMHVWISTLALMWRGLYLQVEAAAADVLQCSDAWRKGSSSAKPASSILRLLAALDDLPAAVVLNEAYALEGMLHSSGTHASLTASLTAALTAALTRVGEQQIAKYLLAALLDLPVAVALNKAIALECTLRHRC